MGINEILRGENNLNYLPEEVKINDLIETPKEFRKRRAIESVAGKVQSTVLPGGVSVNGIPSPLTPEEADLVDQRIVELRNQAALLKAQIQDIYRDLDSQAVTVDGKEVSFRIDISGRPTLKRAVRRVFGQTFDQITYSMYKEVVAAKRQVLDSEADSYLAGE